LDCAGAATAHRIDTNAIQHDSNFLVSPERLIIAREPGANSTIERESCCPPKMKYARIARPAVLVRIRRLGDSQGVPGFDAMTKAAEEIPVRASVIAHRLFSCCHAKCNCAVWG
jgi:hypothetical protein